MYNIKFKVKFLLSHISSRIIQYYLCNNQKYYNPYTITVNGYTKDNINSTYKNKSLAEQVASQRPKK